MKIANICLIFCTVVLVGCVQDPQGYLRRSANNKLFDRYGFYEGKKLPRHNLKYIQRAKKNIYEQEFAENGYYADEDDEAEDPRAYNRSLYKNMIKEERNIQPRRSSQVKITKLSSKEKVKFNNKKSLEEEELYEDNFPFEEEEDSLHQEEKVSLDDYLDENVSFLDIEEMKKQKRELELELKEIKNMISEIKREMAQLVSSYTSNKSLILKNSNNKSLTSSNNKNIIAKNEYSKAIKKIKNYLLL